jgi:hypothetical protein
MAPEVPGWLSTARDLTPGRSLLRGERHGHATMGMHATIAQSIFAR